MRKSSTQASKLLPHLFEDLDEEHTVTVFHVGPALPETVDFFSQYRCKLHFIDLFCELPIVTREEEAPSAAQQFEEILQFPPNTRFDVCLFWDIFNYLNREAVSAFLSVLRPHLKKSCRAHAFSMHNLKTPQIRQLYGINQQDTLSFRNRLEALPG